MQKAPALTIGFAQTCAIMHRTAALREQEAGLVLHPLRCHTPSHNLAPMHFLRHGRRFKGGYNHRASSHRTVTVRNFVIRATHCNQETDIAATTSLCARTGRIHPVAQLRRTPKGSQLGKEPIA